MNALYRVVGMELKKSGNILHLLRSVDEDVAIKLADVSYSKKAKEEEVFQKGIDFGLQFKNKNSFYRIVLNRYVVYFVGTEAEIVTRLNNKLDEMKQQEDSLKKQLQKV